MFSRSPKEKTGRNPTRITTEEHQKLKQLLTDNLTILPINLDKNPDGLERLYNSLTDSNDNITLDDRDNFKTALFTRLDVYQKQVLRAMTGSSTSSKEVLELDEIKDSFSIEELIAYNKKMRDSIVTKSDKLHAGWDGLYNFKAKPLSEKSSWADMLQYLEEPKEVFRELLRSSKITSLLGSTFIDEKCNAIGEMDTWQKFIDFKDDVMSSVILGVNACRKSMGKNSLPESETFNLQDVIDESIEDSKKLHDSFLSRLETESQKNNYYKEAAGPLTKEMMEIGNNNKDSLATKIEAQLELIERAVAMKTAVEEKIEQFNRHAAANAAALDGLAEKAGNLTNNNPTFKAKTSGEQLLADKLEKYIKRIERYKNNPIYSCTYGFFVDNKNRDSSYKRAKAILAALNNGSLNILDIGDTNGIKSSEFRSIVKDAYELQQAQNLESHAPRKNNG